MRLRIVIASAAALVLGGGFAAGILLGSGSRAAAVGTRLPVVAAENVYGNVAAQIGGRHVSVTSILADPNADPHLYEAGTVNGLAVARARLVIRNGLGYDAFVEKLEAAAPAPLRRTLDVADALGVRGRDANPHLWYDVPRLPRIAAAIAAALERADPPHAAAYRAGLRRFEADLAPLRATVARVRARFAGAPVAYTEPVPAYLVAAAGLVDRAPAGFTRAIEEGREPTPQAVAAMNALVRERRIRVLLYNSQAVSPLTRSLRDAARRAGIPVVPVTETLPPGRTFQQWQLAQARALEAALAR
jgi:zinc/manganese transport system substrate-binding protein